jgi:hypothetical protein
VEQDRDDQQQPRPGEAAEGVICVHPCSSAAN